MMIKVANPRSLQSMQESKNPLGLFRSLRWGVSERPGQALEDLQSQETPEICGGLLDIIHDGDLAAPNLQLGVWKILRVRQLR